MRKFTIALFLLLCIGVVGAYAQRTITGKVTSAEDKSTIPGATVIVKGTTIGTITDVDGKYTIVVPANKNALIFSYVGMITVEKTLGESNVLDVVLSASIQELEGIVVTALGIPREKKSLGYATQEVKGDELNVVKTDNFVNSLSGRVAGVQVKTTTNFGGSTNILLRGSKSLTGDNQALFVIDGVPVNNEITNSRSQQQSGQSYDFGNAASDINPDNIESVNVLKGSAATALYGSRAANGVIMITTKKGVKEAGGVTRRGVGVTWNSSASIGYIDRKTFPKYQKEYGGGYGKYYGPNEDDYFNIITVGGVDEKWCPMYEDASYGAKFDPSLQIYQWMAVDKSSPLYQKAQPWVAAANDPVTFFDHPWTLANTISLDNASALGNYRLSYTNLKQKGLMPNSELIKNNIVLNGQWNVNDRLTVQGFANYSTNKGLGRNSTGYNDNILGQFRQWFEMNVDVKDQKMMYDLTNRNITWNYKSPLDPVPAYWDNLYWTRFQNYENDKRNRFIGNLGATYKIANWVNIFGRFSVDTYTELQEERRAVGSIAASFGIGTGADGSLNRSDQESGYLRRDITFSEYNYDLMANFNKDISKSFNFHGVLGMNVRRTNFSRVINSTNGGLSVPELYSLQNSAGPLPLPKELASRVGVDGLYASVSFGFKNLVYLDGTLRRDHASTLPTKSSVYYYPSIAGSFLFSNLIPEAKWLSFGKVRLNYAQVGNGAPFDQLIDDYVVNSPFNGLSTSVPTTKKNPDLKNEKTRSLEGGLEMYFLGRRIGFDLALYKTNTVDQIFPLPVSSSTGYFYKYINAGEIENKGIELALHGTPVKGKNFRWDIDVNWARNWNKVISLYPGVTTLQLGSFQGGVTINAVVGQPYGVIYGTDYVYNGDRRVVNKTNGRYLISKTSDHIIGNVNPDWTGGITNTLTYKSWSLGFLVDVQKGGDIFSLDMYYGLATGLYAETAGTNDLGNPVRNVLTYIDPNDHSKGYASDCGGFINEGVNVAADGTVTENVTRIAANNYGSFGYARLPNRAFVYDATYVKLRQVSLSYSIPPSVLKKSFITGITLTAVASNVWIIFKKMPHADPESGLGAGNLQGYSTGSLPSTRDFSLNLKLTF